MTNKLSHITIATHSDVTGLNHLINGAYRGESSKAGWTNEADLFEGSRTNESELLKLMDEPDTTFLKYLDEGEIAGCVMLQKKNSFIYLGMLTVDPLRQGMGIGKQLLQASDEFARVNNLEKILLTVLSVRTELIEWYIRNGYSDTGKRKPFKPLSNAFGVPKIELELMYMEKGV